MTVSFPPTRFWLAPLAIGLGCLALIFWLRWPTFGYSLWNVDEAIHAAAARTILDGGVLYRDAIDQRTPLSYYAVAGIFALCGENNLWAVRCAVAGLIAATALLLFFSGRNLRNTASGASAAIIYGLLASCALSQTDANAAHTEWLVAFFSTAAAAVFITGGPSCSKRRLFISGWLYGCSFLSKQPALLDLLAPAATIIYLGWAQSQPRHALLRSLLSLATGWLTPVLLTMGYFATQGALREGIFYTWTYNLSYYGPEITSADRLLSLGWPLRLIGAAQPGLLILWIAGAAVILHRLLQRHPSPPEIATNPSSVFLAAWSLAALVGAAAGGRSFDHYSIQFFAPFCLGTSLALVRFAQWSWSGTTGWPIRVAGVSLLIALIYSAGAAALGSRRPLPPEDTSQRVSAYIRKQSTPADQIFVWGYYPDIYLFADRRPASRYLYASFLTGLIPWTNTEPARDTTYAIVPGAMKNLIQDLTAHPPRFIVDTSAGPNRFWQKYPLEKFPALHDFIRRHYRVVEAAQFVGQGFRLFQWHPGNEVAAAESMPTVAPEIITALALPNVTTRLTPERAATPHGASVQMNGGHLEFFAHAPSVISYRLPADAHFIRGGFGFRPSAYSLDNATPTDGAEFIITWTSHDGIEHELLRRRLDPRKLSADRGIQSFRIAIPARAQTGDRLDLQITPGPADDATSDWTTWTDLVLESSP